MRPFLLKAFLFFGLLPVCRVAFAQTAPAISYNGGTNAVTFDQGSSASFLPNTTGGGTIPGMAYGVVSTPYGNTIGGVGSANGTGNAASFYGPIGLVSDEAGTLYVTDYSNNLIRKIVLATGAVTTLAGSGVAGNTNGTGTAASFNNPFGICIDPTKTILYVTDRAGIRKIVIATAVVSTISGTAVGYPGGITTDASGANLYYADGEDNILKKVIISSGIITTYAGNGTAGSTNSTSLTSAEFNDPGDLAFDASGNLFVADVRNNQIRKINASGVTLYAGSPTGAAGTTDGTGTAATFYGINSLSFDLAGNMYVSEVYVIRKITPAAAVSTLAGENGVYGNTNGTSFLNSTFDNLFQSYIDGSGNMYLNNTSDNNIRQLTLGGWAISGALPAGISFDATTGILSGTPTVNGRFPVGITAYNLYGSSTANVTILVNAPPPNISYNTGTNAVAFIKGSPGSSVPTNAGGDVPAISYGVVSTPYGSATGISGNTNNTGNAARFSSPDAVVADGAGNLYVADAANNLIRKVVISTGAVTTLAGSGTTGGANGTGTAASFNDPEGICIDPTNTILYVSEGGNGDIREIIIATGVVSSITAVNGSYTPHGLAIDASGTNLYFADYTANVIRKAVISSGAVTTYAGNGTAGKTNSATLTSAEFFFPSGVAFDASENLFVADYGNNEIREINASGVTLFAGSATGAAGSTNATGTSATFSLPRAISFDAAGNMYVGDINNHLVREITPAGLVTTLAGEAGTAGYSNGASFTSSTFGFPGQSYIDASGNMYLPDIDYNNIRLLTICGWAISGVLPDGISFDATTGILSGNATVTGAFPVVVTAYNLYGSSTANVTITVSTPPVPNISYNAGTNAVTFIQGSPGSNSPTNTGGAVPALAYGVVSTPYGSLFETSGNTNGIGNGALFKVPLCVAGDGAGNLYVVDGSNNLIRKITTSTGAVTTLAGSGTNGTMDGTGTGASFSLPMGICIDPTKTILYVADNGGIRKIVIATAVVSTLPGTAGADGFGLTTDASGANLYIACFTDNVIRKVVIATGALTTYAGNGTQGNTNSTTLTSAEFNDPEGVAFDGSGNLFVADGGNNEIREINASGVTLFAGSATGAAGSTNGGGTMTSFNIPVSISFDAAGNMYVGETGNHLIRKITPAGAVTTLAGEAGIGGFSNGTSFTTSTFEYPRPSYIDASGNLYIAEPYANNIRQLTICGYAISGTLPSGISFDATTGILSGNATVTGTFPVVITAYNFYGSSTANVTINCTAAPVPNISYNAGTNAITLTDGTNSSNSPANTGGAVPALAYGVVSTPCGSTTGVSGNTNSTGNNALFNFPTSVVGDGAGNLYVADQGNNLIRKMVISTGAVTTFAGSGTRGGTDGTGTGASFYAPSGICIDPTQTVLYVSDENGIRKIVIATAAVSTLTTAVSGWGLTTDATGANLYATGSNGYMISKVVISSGTVTTYAGNGTAGKTNSTMLTSAEFNVAEDVGFDASGNLFVDDHDNNEIREINASGVTLFAGSATGTYGSTNGNGTSASFSFPNTLSLDAAGNIYVCELGTSLIRKITPAAAVTTLAGEADVFGETNGPTLTTSDFNDLGHPYIDASGNMYVPDYGNNNIRKLTICGWAISGALPLGISFDATTGILSGAPLVSGTFPVVITAYNFYGGSTANVTITCNTPTAPNISYTPNTEDYLINAPITALSPANSGGSITVSGFGTGVALTGGTLKNPYGMAFDAGGSLYVTNYATATNNVLEYNTTTSAYTGIFIARTSFPQKQNPTSIVFDASGNAYSGEDGGYLYKFTSAGTYSSTITTNALAIEGMAIDASNNIYLADDFGNAVYEYSTTGTRLLRIRASTILSTPINVAVDGGGCIYVLDAGNQNLQKYTSAGVYVATLVSGLSTPYGLCLDSYGDIYIGDSGTGKVTVYTPAGTLITSITGLTDPRGLIVDASGNLYVSDFTKNTITKYPPVYYTISGGTLPSGISFNSNTGTFSGTPLADFGPVTFTITANGQFGTSSSCTETITVGGPPVFSYANPPVYTVGTGISNLSPTITSGGPITSASINPGLPSGLSITAAGVITGTPMAVSASTVYTITATNATGGSGTAMVTISVAAPPVFGYTTPVAYTVGTAISNLTPTVASGGPVTSASISPGLPASLSINSVGVITGTPMAASASTVYTVTAVNAAGGTGTCTVTITVGAAPNISYNAGTNAITYTEGTPGSNSPANTGGAVPATAYGVVSTLYGSTAGAAGNANGTGNAARFNQLQGLAGDGAGNLYVADQTNNLIRKIVISTGVVTTFAGSGTAGTTNGTGTAASFNYPDGICIDAAGANLYVADYYGGDIRKIVIATGVVTTIASNSAYGPAGLTLDAAGANLYFADQKSNMIREVALSSGSVTTYAGNGTVGRINSTTLTSAEFNQPIDIAFDASGNLFVADYFNNEIREINASGVTLFAGSPTGAVGSTNGTGAAASFNYPAGVIFDVAGNLYVGETNQLRKIAPAAVVTTPGISTNSALVTPLHMYIDPSGNMYVPDAGTNNIRELPIVGWAISGALPSGITFDATSGILSGTATSPGTYNVAITAYNLYGSSTANVAITVPGPVFSYTTPQVYTAGTAISNLSPTIASGGPLTSASISPGLPTGLSITSAGVITGTPTTASPATFYTITSTNAAGNTACATVVISIMLPSPNISYNGGTDVVAFVNGVSGSNSPTNTGGGCTGHGLWPGNNTLREYDRCCRQHKWYR